MQGWKERLLSQGGREVLISGPLSDAHFHHGMLQPPEEFM